MLKAKLIDSTNKMVATNFKDCHGEFYIEEGMVFIKNEKPFSIRAALHRTSLIEDYFIKDKNKLYVTTLNSIYQYEILEGTQDEFHNAFSKINNDSKIKAFQEIRSKKYKNYIGQSADGWIGPIGLPNEMDWNEATNYIRKNTILVGIDGSVVVRLTTPIEDQ